MEDADIRELLRAEDPGALRLMLERYGDGMYVACKRLGLDRATAEDAVQDALLRAWRARGKVAEAAALGGYLVRTAHNAGIDALRTAARRRGILRDHAEVLAPAGDADHVVDRGSQASLSDCLEALPDDYARRAVELRFGDKRSWSQIAEDLAPPREADDTVRMRVKRALRALRTCLEEKGVSW